MKPLPNLEDSAAMARLGRLSARNGVLHDMRDSSTKLLHGSGDDGLHIVALRQLLDQLEFIISLESKEYRR
jgi:hypothetical protein